MSVDFGAVAVPVCCVFDEAVVELAYPGHPADPGHLAALAHLIVQIADSFVTPDQRSYKNKITAYFLY